jgi:prefoldin subunit 5
MDQNTRDILEAVNFIKEKVEQLPTKNDVRGIIREEVPNMIREELKPIHHELREINRRLDMLDEEYKNLKGVTKEIDEIRDEVRAIQKHLGIEKKIAA